MSLMEADEPRLIEDNTLVTLHRDHEWENESHVLIQESGAIPIDELELA